MTDTVISVTNRTAAFAASDDFEQWSRAHCQAHGNANVFEIWQEMIQGFWEVQEHRVDTARSYARLRRRSPLIARALRIEPSRLAILRRTLEGESQKSIAIDLGVGDSSVAATLADCRRRLGLHCRGSALPLIVIQLAQATWTPFDAELWLSADSTSDSEGVIISMRRPDADRIEGLTRAESNVAARLIEGWSQREIARLRNARPRTIVNQMANLRRKLRVSGRLELVRLLSTRQQAS